MITEIRNRRAQAIRRLTPRQALLRAALAVAHIIGVAMVTYGTLKLLDAVMRAGGVA